MSSRALRRLMDEVKEPSEEEETEEECPRLTQKKNVFDLLALEDLDVDEEEEGGVVEEKGREEDTEKTPPTREGTDAFRSKKKQKKNKRGKRQAREKTEAGGEEDEQFDLDSYARAVEEERRRMAELDQGDGATAGAGVGSERAVLAVDHRCLDADYEMSRIFGSNFVRNETAKRLGGRMPGAGLVRPKAQWPPAAQIGLSMRKVEGESEAGMWFVVEHTKEYRAVSDKFYEALHSHNPNNLQEIFRRQPYHVNTLLQMSEVFRMEEDFDTAGDLIERAVFAFTRSAHPLFNVSSGRCLLDYRYEENRGFFVSLFMHIQFVGRRGCYRTALEFCKVLLSLNPKKDPLAAILMIDHLCIMAGELDYLLRLYREWQTFKNLSQLPNFAFSCALAHFRRRERAEGDEDGSLLLQDALLRFPGWLSVLLDKCGIKPDDRVAQAPFFQQTGPEGLTRLYSLHVGRTHHCWKEAAAMQWLERNVAAVLDVVEAGEDPRIKEYAEHRSRRYRETPIAVLRHIFLSSIPGVSFSMPSRMAPDAIAIFDPLPPKDSISLHPRQPSRRRAQLQTGFLGPLLNSMLPTYDPQEEFDHRRDAPGHRSEDLLETIRQLLAGIQPNPPPVAHRQEDVEGEDPGVD